MATSGDVFDRHNSRGCARWCWPLLRGDQGDCGRETAQRPPGPGQPQNRGSSGPQGQKCRHEETVRFSFSPSTPQERIRRAERGVVSEAFQAAVTAQHGPGIFTNRRVLLATLEAGSLRSRRWPVWCLVRICFPFPRRASAHCTLTRPRPRALHSACRTDVQRAPCSPRPVGSSHDDSLHLRSPQQSVSLQDTKKESYML